MARRLIVAHFRDYAAAHRAFCALLQSGVRAEDMTLLPGDRSDREGVRDMGLLTADAEHHVAALRRGVSLLAVRVRRAQGARVGGIVGDHAPSEIAEMAAHESVTMSGAPADRPPSPGRLGEEETGSVIERDADLVDAVTPEGDTRHRRR